MGDGGHLDEGHTAAQQCGTAKERVVVHVTYRIFCHSRVLVSVIMTATCSLDARQDLLGDDRPGSQ